MIVVSDTSAITSLLQIGRVELLSRIYSDVFIPEAVRDELLREHPSIPEFIRCQSASNRAEVQRLLAELDLGEAEAIILAKELKADELLIDETAGRRIAAREGVNVIACWEFCSKQKDEGLFHRSDRSRRNWKRKQVFAFPTQSKKCFSVKPVNYESSHCR
jgi:predicted nucleic acid-binding protein